MYAGISALVASISLSDSYTILILIFNLVTGMDLDRQMPTT
jgi:hypothetical protein